MANYRSNFDGYAFNNENSTPHRGKGYYEEEERGLVKGSNRNLLREFLFLIPLAFFLIVLFFSVALIIYNHHQQDNGRKEAHSALDYLAHNLKKAPIHDLKLIAHATNCPEGFEKEGLGHYPGTESGCMCKDGSVHTKSYCWFKSSDECKYSGASQSHEVKVWATHSFCVKRFSNWKFIKAASECPSTMKVCQKEICVSGTECPVSKLSFVAGTGSTTQVNATHKYELHRETTKSPVVSLEADISQYPCVAHSLHRPSTKSKKYYPLERQTSKGCGKYGSLHEISTHIDSYSQEKFYKENGVEKQIQALPFHKELTSPHDDANLVSVDRIEIKATKECENIEADKITHLSKEIEEISTAYEIIGILLIIFSAIGLALVLLFLVLRKKISILNGRGGYIIILILMAICIILATVMFALHTHQQNSDEFNSIKTHFSNLDKHNCIKNESFKRASKDVAQSADASHSKLNWLVQILFWTSVAALVLLLLAIVFRKVKKLSLIPDPRI